jgi:DNA-binding MarR family transcriptional regulator
MEPLADADYGALLAFRTALRRFQRWSETQAKKVGLTHPQHQLLLAIKGHPGERPTIGELADYLLLRHHSTVELVNRVQKGGYVERVKDDKDGRVVRVVLTEKGTASLDRLTQLHLSELQQLAPLLDHVVGGGRRPTASPGEQP